MSQSRRKGGKSDEFSEKSSGTGELFTISSKDERGRNKKIGAAKDKETTISSSSKRNEILKKRLGRNLKPNLQLAMRILPAETFPQVFPGLSDPHTYVDFILAVGKFAACANPSSSATTCIRRRAR